MPHCAIGPVALTACMHVDAAVPNFLIQESVGPDFLAGVIQPAWKVVNGFIELPTVPGLGIEVDEKEVVTMTKYTEELGGEWFYESDGSVADW